MKIENPTGYPPGSYVTDARQEKVYRVEKDGSWRLLPIPARLFLEHYQAGQQPVVDKPRSFDPS